jgi:hypothetical protein
MACSKTECKKGDDVADGLGRKAGDEHRGGDGLDVGDRHAVDGLVAESRRDVDALHRLAVLQVGLAGALDGKPAAQRVDDLVERVALDPCSDRAVDLPRFRGVRLLWS